MLKKTNDALISLSSDKFFKDHDVRFVGGTALSYLIKHRLSEDLDFAMLELPKNEILELMQRHGAIKKEHNRVIIDTAMNDGEDIDDSHMMFDLNGVKVDFFTPPFNIKEVEIWKDIPFTLYENTDVKVAAFETIMYMKTMAFWNRKKYRDLYDIYYALSIESITYSPSYFVRTYTKYNITYSTEDLLAKIQSKSEFYEKKSDEGLHTLVENPKPYEWYRNKIEEFIYNVYLSELYSTQ